MRSSPARASTWSCSHATSAKRETALGGAQNAARAEAVGDRIKLGSYDKDLERTVKDADLIFESLAEDLSLKKTFFDRVDKCRRPDSIVATGSSGLSIAEMARGRSDSFREHFLGVHLFNPPQVIVGTEVIPHPETDPEVTKRVCEMLDHAPRTQSYRHSRPARVRRQSGRLQGAQRDARSSPKSMASHLSTTSSDRIPGARWRRWPPIDLVGWDVHKAIVDNVYANTEDEARACFRLPAFMERGVKEGKLGDKTPKQGGFYRKDGNAVEVARSEYRVVQAAGKACADRICRKNEAV